MIDICSEGHTETTEGKTTERETASKATDWLNAYRGQQPTFACILSFTETGLIPNISAAGKTVEDRRYTAAADGEFLVADAGRQQHRHQNLPPLKLPPSKLPPLEAGVSPAVISRAVLQALSIPTHLFSTGLPVDLNVPHIALPTVQARSVETGQAMSLAQAETLFAAGHAWGMRLASANRYLIIGECVVGGTTTAQAVLTALGYEVDRRMSSSHLVGNHSQKQQLVNQGLTAWQHRSAPLRESLYNHSHDPLSRPLQRSAMNAAAAVGDPMQLVAAGMLLAASQISGVLLAGGAQMLAVYALAKEIAQQKALTWQTQQVVVGTTRWVIEDKSADTVAIARQIKAPYLASQIHFGQSPYMQLRAYEQGFVKEGVGAGGCAIAAHLYKGWTRSQLRHAVEAQLRHAF